MHSYIFGLLILSHLAQPFLKLTDALDQLKPLFVNDALLNAALLTILFVG